MNMKKKLVSSLVTVALILSATPAFAASADEVLTTMDGKAVTATWVRGVNPCDFTDSMEIKHWTAVGTLAIWGVIAGKDNGAFDPTAPVTRGEMAKLICAMRYGGHDLREEPSPEYSFTDTQNHWAARYISDCAERGVIVGRGDGTFDPNAPVTGVEAAKMLLSLLNYDADVFGLTGTNWKNHTLSAAVGAKLFTDLDGLQTDAPLSRDDAAQMLYNTLYASVMTAEEIEMDGEITYKYSIKDSSLTGSFMVKAFGGTLGGPPDQYQPDRETP